MRRPRGVRLCHTSAATDDDMRTYDVMRNPTTLKNAPLHLATTVELTKRSAFLLSLVSRMRHEHLGMNISAYVPHLIQSRAYLSRRSPTPLTHACLLVCLSSAALCVSHRGAGVSLEASTYFDTGLVSTKVSVKGIQHLLYFLMGCAVCAGPIRSR